MPRRKLTTGDWVRLVIPVLLVAGFIFAAWKLGYFDLESPQKLQRAARKARSDPWLAPAFVAAYVVVATFAAPISPLAYVAGAMFGVVKGSICVWIGAMIAATAGYWLARGIWSGTAKRLLGRYEEKLQELQRGSAFLTVLRLQLLPIAPFGILMYASAVVRLNFLAFLAGTALGIVPGTVAAVYVGDRVAAGLTGHEHRALIIAGVIMAALIGLSFVPKLFERQKDRTSDAG